MDYNWVAESLAKASKLSEEEWHDLHGKVENFGCDLHKMLASAPSEEEKISILQAGHDALYLLSGNVTVAAERRYLSVALSMVEKYLEEHEGEYGCETDTAFLSFLKLSLNLLYSSRFFEVSPNPSLSTRLANYLSRSLDNLRSSHSGSNSLVAEIFALEEELFLEA